MQIPLLSSRGVWVEITLLVLLYHLYLMVVGYFLTRYVEVLEDNSDKPKSCEPAP